MSDEDVEARLCQEGVVGDVLPGDFLMKTVQDVMGLFSPKQWLTFISVESVIVSYNVGYKENYVTYWDLCTFKLITSKKQLWWNYMFIWTIFTDELVDSKFSF